MELRAVLGLGAVVFVATALSGCGDEDGVDTDGGGFPQDSSVPDGGANDGSLPPDGGFLGSMERLLAAQDSNRMNECECAFAAAGFASATECFEALRVPDFARTCRLDAFRANRRELSQSRTCLAMAREAFDECLETNGCDSLGTCAEARFRARQSCPIGSFSAESSFAESVRGCEESTRLGEPSGCPDVDDASSELGAGVFTGDSTGAGDDFQLGCAMEFVAADVALQWTTPSAGTYRFDSAGSSFMTIVAVLDGCDGSELACGAGFTAEAGDGVATANLDAGQTVVVVIDGTDVIASGYYRLSIEAIE